ncbi:MAG: SCO family protein [Elusimicrobiota bacterium]|nr:SCO family protein [Elusimicrobiota bacterium]
MRRLLLAVPLVLAACGPKRGPSAEPLTVLPEFAMTAVGPDGESPFGLADLKGKVWIADFIFTRCAGPCPLMTARLAKLGERLPPEVSLLTVSVDPAGDTPGRLRAYARHHGADARRWVFLRGGTEETYRLLYAGFRLPMSTDPAAAPELRVTHSTRFVLVDRAGAVRGYYDALSDLENDALARDARRLLEAGS